MNGVRQDSARGESPAAPPKASFWRSMKMVAWGLLGIRRRKDYQQDLSQVSPFHVLVAGLIALVLFIAVLLLIVRWAVSSGSAAI